MYKQVIVYLFLLLLTAQKTYADFKDFECAAKGEIESKLAPAEISKVQNAYGAIAGMHADFVQDSFLSALEISEVSSGEVWFLKPGKMKWVYKKPERQVFTVKDETLWLYQEADKQVVVDSFSKMLISDLPAAFILGIGDLEKSFTVTNACRNKSGSGIYFNLTPKQNKLGVKDEGLKSFELVVSADTYMPRAARVHDLGANINTIYLEHIRSTEKITEEIFETKYPAGTDIDDRRKK